MVLENGNKLNQWHEVLQQQGFGNSEAQKTLIVVLSATTSPMSGDTLTELTEHHITHYHLQLLGICADCQTNHL